MTNNFHVALKFVLDHEGYKSSHSKDPGGRTIFGISERYYPEVDTMWNMSYEDAKKLATVIYKKDYWVKSGCDTLPFPYDIIVFDTAVNMGVYKADRFLSSSKTGKDFLLKRIESYAAMKHFNTFGRGWVNRVIDLYNLVESMKI